MTAQEFVAEIDLKLNSGLQTNLTSQSALSDVFEVYLLALVLEAARNEGASTIAFETTSGQAASELVFRTSPSSIFSGAFTHAVIAFPGKAVLEAHTGVYVSAKSKVRHECDVAVLLQNEAGICRQNNVHPRFHKLVLSIECKFYASSLGIDLARSFVGLLADIQSKERFFVANTSSDSVKTMLSFHNKNWACDIHPAQERNVRNLLAHFEAVFSRFKAAI